MAAILENVSAVSTSLLGIAGQTVSFITSNALMLTFFCISIVGAGVSLFQRLRG